MRSPFSKELNHQVTQERQAEARHRQEAAARQARFERYTREIEEVVAEFAARLRGKVEPQPIVYGHHPLGCNHYGARRWSSNSWRPTGLSGWQLQAVLNSTSLCVSTQGGLLSGEDLSRRGDVRILVNGHPQPPAGALILTASATMRAGWGCHGHMKRASTVEGAIDESDRQVRELVRYWFGKGVMDRDAWLAMAVKSYRELTAPPN